MSLTLSDFISHIKKHSIASVNRYNIVFSLPQSLIAYEADSRNSQGTIAGSDRSSQLNSQSPVGTEKMISLSCLTADIPAFGAKTSEQQYGNYERKVPFDRSIGEFTTSFIITGLMNEKRLFDAWQEIMFDQNRHRVGYYDDFITSISVQCLNKADVSVYEYELTEAYPLSVSSIKLDRTSQNQQMLMEVAWAFHKIKYDPNKYSVSSISGLTSDEYDAIINPSTGGSAKELNLPEIPAVHYSQVELNDIIKAVRRIRDQIKRGEVDPQNALRLYRQIAADVKALIGLPQDAIDSVLKTIGDIMAGMPIPVPGIPGGIPQRLPF